MAVVVAVINRLDLPASCTVLLEGPVVEVATAVLSEGNVHAAVVPLAHEDEGHSGNAKQENNVEHTVEDGGAGTSDPVAAVRETPSDRVQDPEQDGVASKEGVVGFGADVAGAAEVVQDDAADQKEHGKGAEDEEAPLVIRDGVSANEIVDDPIRNRESVEVFLKRRDIVIKRPLLQRMGIPDPAEEYLVDDGRPRHAAQQAEDQDDGGELHDPVDVFDPEDLARKAIGALPDRGRYNSPAEIRRVGKVRDAGDEERNAENVMENLLSCARLEANANDGQLSSEKMI